MDKKETAPEVEGKETKKENLASTEENQTKVGNEEKTVEEVLNLLDEKTDKQQTEGKLVPEAALIQYKRENKTLKRQIEAFKRAKEEGADGSETTEGIAELAEEFDLDPRFLSKLKKAVRGELEQDIDQLVETRLKPLSEKERVREQNRQLTAAYKSLIKQRPEYEGIVNIETFKALALHPQNRGKTLSSILADSFGHLVKGRATLDTTVARSGEESIDKLDYERAQKDVKYFKQIMSNPKLRKEYNDRMISESVL